MEDLLKGEPAPAKQILQCETETWNCAPCAPNVGDRVVIGEYGRNSSRKFRLIERDMRTGDCTVLDLDTDETQSRDIYELAKVGLGEPPLLGADTGDGSNDG